MRNNKTNLILLVVPTLLILLVLAVVSSRKTVEVNDRIAEATAAYELPDYVQIEDDDTFFDAVNLDGEWRNKSVPDVYIVFAQDGTYSSNSDFFDGTYKQYNGFVVLTDTFGFDSVIRLVATENGVALQRDMSSLPMQFVRPEYVAEPQEGINYAEQDSLQRLAISSVNQTLNQCYWEDISKDSILKHVSFGTKDLYYRSGNSITKYASYKVTYVKPDDSISADNAIIELDGKPYVLQLKYITMPMQDAYILTIKDTNGDILVHASSTSDVELTQPD